MKYLFLFRNVYWIEHVTARCIWNRGSKEGITVIMVLNCHGSFRGKHFVNYFMMSKYVWFSTWVHPRLSCWGHVAQFVSFLCSVLFVLFLLAIALSVLRYTASDNSKYLHPFLVNYLDIFRVHFNNFISCQYW